MKIIIETVPHAEQRYPTVGDWYFDDEKVLHIKVSGLNDMKQEMLVALHELIEAIICTGQGIEEQRLTDFDKQFEELRGLYPGIIGNQEPGNMISSPYYDAHQKATSIEIQLASYLGVDWDEYDTKVNNL